MVYSKISFTALNVHLNHCCIGVVAKDVTEKCDPTAYEGAKTCLSRISKSKLDHLNCSIGKPPELTTSSSYHTG